jgi:hypothetical protein
MTLRSSVLIAQSNVDNLAYLAFWAYNATLLLHLLRTDPGLETVCDELGLLGMMEELINAVHGESATTQRMENAKTAQSSSSA